VTRSIAWALLALGVAQSGAGAQERREIRFGGIGHSGNFNALVASEVSATTGTMTGGELYIWLAGAGFRVRVTGGSFAEDGIEVGEVAMGEAALSIGVSQFAIEAGAGRRAFAGPRSTVVGTYARAGFSTHVPVGASGFTGRILGAVIVPFGSELEMTGFDLETGLFWFPKRVPIYLTAGYRYNRLTVASQDGERPEEFGAALIGLGIRFVSRDAPP
jgi:hypothetical protein